MSACASAGNVPAVRHGPSGRKRLATNARETSSGAKFDEFARTTAPIFSLRATDTFGEFQFAYHYGSVVSPYIHFEEPLRLECLHFVECVLERTRPLTDGNNGVQVVRVIEAAQRSLRDGGSQVRIGGGIRTGRDQGELVWINGDADPVLDLAGTDVDRREATTAEAR